MPVLVIFEMPKFEFERAMANLNLVMAMLKSFEGHFMRLRGVLEMNEAPGSNPDQKL
jgi:hypothetical protein